MKIIVVGDGKVGFAIAKQLNQEGHDITVVENKSSVLSMAKTETTHHKGKFRKFFDSILSDD